MLESNIGPIQVDPAREINVVVLDETAVKSDRFIDLRPIIRPSADEGPLYGSVTISDQDIVTTDSTTEEEEDLVPKDLSVPKPAIDSDLNEEESKAIPVQPSVTKVSGPLKVKGNGTPTS